VTDPSRWETGLPALVLAAAAVLGGAAGLLIAPHAAAVVLASTLVQLGATALGWRLTGRSALVTGVVAVVTLGIALEPTLRELLRLGAVPWAVLALAFGTLNLVRRARSMTELVSGVALSSAAAAVSAVVTAQGGAPLVPSLLASSVPVLGGALVATVQRLNEARRDRLSRPVVPPVSTGDDTGGARQALLLVALRAESMLTAARDETAAAQARDLRTVALQGLNAPDAASGPRLTVRIDVASAGAEGEQRAPEPDGAETPALSEREGEIARLLTTGASNARIARELYLSEATIKGHVSRMMRRFDCGNRTQLALMAARWFG
jgi:DNA-binding CsgD family transcriptional regulator